MKQDFKVICRLKFEDFTLYQARKTKPYKLNGHENKLQPTK